MQSSLHTVLVPALAALAAGGLSHLYYTSSSSSSTVHSSSQHTFTFSTQPQHEDDTRQMPPPPYSSLGTRFNHTIRPARSSDAPAISAIHTHWTENTDALMHEKGQGLSAVKEALRFFQDDCKLPYLVATVPIDATEAEQSRVGSGSQTLADSGISTKSPTPPATPQAEELPLSKEETTAGERVIAYSLASSHQPYSGIDGYRRTAEVYVLVAPGYLHRGVGTSLLNTTISELESLRWVPPEKRSLSHEEQVKASVPRWREVLAVMPVRLGEFSETQKRFWSSSGFREVGRLQGVVEKWGVARDVWVWQRSLQVRERL